MGVRDKRGRAVRDVTSLMSVFVPLFDGSSDRSIGVWDADHNRIRHAHKLTPRARAR